MSTFERIKKLFIENFEFDGEKLTPETTLESLGLDSLDKIDFIFALETEFDIRIEPSEIKTDTIRQIIESIDKMAAEQKTAAAAAQKK
ncbi:MAG: acyl carrier protein [Deltaproteobacteria bacterium]|nr:acyl carrier protein [Deltaproteobacteria bacterium]